MGHGSSSNRNHRTWSGHVRAPGLLWAQTERGERDGNMKAMDAQVQLDLERLVKSLKKSHDFRPVLGTRIRYSAKTSRCLVHTISVLVGGWPTPLKNISQLGLLFPIFEKKKHQPGYFCSEQIKKNNENIQGWPKGTAANVFSWWASLCSPWTVGQVRHNIRCFRVYKLV